MATWTPLFALSELPPGGRRVVRVAGARIAVFRLDDGEVYAIDDVCPHEGYPLSEGVVRGDTITCSWHAFRFALADGRCVVGDEAVRAFPVRVVAGELQADVAPPDPAQAIPVRLQSLDEAVAERRLGQVTRDLQRLLQHGVPPAALLHRAVAYDAVHAPYGLTHVFPLAADLRARWALVQHDALRLLAVVAPFELAAEQHPRRPARPTPPPEAPAPDAAQAGARLRERVEQEDLAGAEALLRGMLAAGWGRSELEPLLLRVCSDHFLDIGHHVIYLAKLFDYAEAVGEGALADVLPAWLVGVVNGTRHDTLPRWQWLRGRLDALGSALDAPVIGAAAPRDAARRAQLVEGLAGRDRDLAFDRVAAALAAGALDDVLDALSIAAAERLLRFDAHIEGDPEIQDGWLDVSHAFTYVHGLRAVAPRFREPGLVRLVFFAVRYVQSLVALDAQTPEEAPAAPLTLQEALTRALTREDVRPIVTAHLVKLSVAAFEESAVVGDPRVLQALGRVLEARFVVRTTPQLAYEARRLVEQGKVPKTRW